LTIRRRVVITGRVQGVFFRDSCQREVARRGGVAGWVRNTNDGAVEAVFEGEPGAVDAMVTWCRGGPPRARVDRVDVVEEQAEGLTQFRVRGWD
jgi:acylphosphatase